MMQCELCNAMRSAKEIMLFEDPHSLVILHPHGASPGHLIIMPKVHYPILEQIPDEELRQLFRAMKLMATSLEKGLGTHDLNVVIANGSAAGQEFPHFNIQLIPRGQGDRIKVSWEGLTVAKSDMDAVESKLREACTQFRKEEKKQEEIKKEPVEEPKTDKTDYAIRQVRRIP